MAAPLPFYELPAAYVTKPVIFPSPTGTPIFAFPTAVYGAFELNQYGSPASVDELKRLFPTFH